MLFAGRIECSLAVALIGGRAQSLATFPFE
jgi:hypothetical protein